MAWRIVAIVAALGLLVGALIYWQKRPRPLVVSGIVEADEIRVGSRVGGRVAKVHVREGQAVAAGAVLIELEAFDQDARLREAEAQAAGKRAEREKLKAGPRKQEIGAADARLKLAQAQQALAESNYKRLAASFESKAASRDELDQASNELKVAQSTVVVRQEELDELKEGTRAEEIEAASAAATAAEATVDVLKQYRAELTVKAPVAGTVEAMELQPGDLVAANAPVLSLLDESTLRIRAFVPENRLGVQVGAEVAVTVDSFPGRTFRGKISFISRQGEFTPSNVQTPEERSKQVFRIKVIVEDAGGVLHPGMSADINLDKRPQEANR